MWSGKPSKYRQESDSPKGNLVPCFLKFKPIQGRSIDPGPPGVSVRNRLRNQSPSTQADTASKMASAVTFTIEADASPFLAFAKVLQVAFKCADLPIDLSGFSGEFVRTETDHESATAGKLRVRFYPSDCFLDHVATLLARDGKFDGI